MTLTKNQHKTPTLTGQSVEEKRTELKQYFLNTWSTYESLFSLINNDEAYFMRPEPLRHPLIFYFGHTATFYINKLILGKFISKRINERLEAICAVGVDEMSWDDLNSAHYDWPEVDEVRQYREQVSVLVCSLIDEMDISLPITQDSLAWIILMGCEHERIHLETSSVIMRMLPLKFLTENEQWPTCEYVGNGPKNLFEKVSKTTVSMGKPESDQTFGWDNEYGSQRIHVDEFLASKFLVSNAEFLAFVDAGGYQNPEWWTEEGKKWLAYKKPSMPHFWYKKDGSYYQRNLLNQIPLPLDWPVEVNYLEAKAFCSWKSDTDKQHIRLPTEAEWYCLREFIDSDLVSWNEAPGNINLEYFASSCPVNRFSSKGFYDIIGNVWQWTESAIDGFSGFKVHPLYDDFSTPTFDGQHNLIKGGSWISTGNEAIKSSRYAFRRHFFQHAGFRYVAAKSKEIPITPVNHFETDITVCQQLEEQYGGNYLNIENFAVALARLVKKLVNERFFSTTKLLDLGCGVGRTSFELSDLFEHIDGVDFSARYIQHGVQLQNGKSVRYESINEGEIVDFNEISLNQLNLVPAKNIHFSQGDATNLKDIFNYYDVIICQKVIEESYDPQAFLKQVHQRLNTGGILVLVSDYQFKEEVLSKNKWLGGLKVNGENVTGFDGVSAILTEKFTLLLQQNLKQLIKTNARHFHVIEKHITVWKLT